MDTTRQDAGAGHRPAHLLVTARDESMRRFVGLLLGELPACLSFADDDDATRSMLRTNQFTAAIVISEEFGIPSRLVADVMRVRHTEQGMPVLFAAHEPPGEEWDFADFIQLPFATGDLVERVRRLLPLE